MKIAIITLYFPPISSIASLRLYSFAKQWQKEGHEVIVITLFNNNQTVDYFKKSDIKVMEIYSFFNVIQKFYRKIFKKKSENVQVIINHNLVKKSGIVTKILSIVKEFFNKKGIMGIYRMPDPKDFWIFKASNYLNKFVKPDIILSSCGPYSTHLVAYLCKRKNNKIKWVADYRDLWTQNYFYPGLFPINKFEKFLEFKILKKADLVTTVSNNLKNDLEGFLGRHVTVIENGFDIDDIQNLSDESFFPSDETIRLVFTGTIYDQYLETLEMVFDILSYIKSHKIDLKINFLIYSKFNQKVHELINKYQLNKMVFQCGFLPREKCLLAQRDSTANIQLGVNDSNFNGVISGKIFEYIFSNTPIFCFNYDKNAEIFHILNKSKAHYTTINNISEIETFIEKIILYKSFQKKGFYKDNFPYLRSNLANSLMQRIEKIGKQ